MKGSTGIFLIKITLVTGSTYRRGASAAEEKIFTGIRRNRLYFLFKREIL